MLFPPFAHLARCKHRNHVKSASEPEGGGRKHSERLEQAHDIKANYTDVCVLVLGRENQRIFGTCCSWNEHNATLFLFQ